MAKSAVPTAFMFPELSVLTVIVASGLGMYTSGIKYDGTTLIPSLPILNFIGVPTSMYISIPTFTAVTMSSPISFPLPSKSKKSFEMPMRADASTSKNSPAPNFFPKFAFKEKPASAPAFTIMPESSMLSASFVKSITKSFTKTSCAVSTFSFATPVTSTLTSPYRDSGYNSAKQSPAERNNAAAAAIRLIILCLPTR